MLVIRQKKTRFLFSGIFLLIFSRLRILFLSFSEKGTDKGIFLNAEIQKIKIWEVEIEKWEV